MGEMGALAEDKLVKMIPLSHGSRTTYGSSIFQDSTDRVDSQQNPKSSQVETTKGFGCFRYERKRCLGIRIQLDLLWYFLLTS